MRLLVAGGFDANNAEQRERIQAFASALGAGVVEHNHVLLNGCRTEFDTCVAEAAYTKLKAMGEQDPDKRVISYVLDGLTPSHSFGTIIRSQLPDWELDRATFYIPEQLQAADAVILVGGFGGTFRAANWARIARKPLLPFTAFGGAAAEIYKQELRDFDAKYSSLVEQLEYEQLNAFKNDWTEHATDVVALAEKVAESRSVLVIMSYANRPELQDIYATMKRVTEKLGYKCDRVSEKNTEKRIIPEILEQIRRAGFTIVDLTDLRENVFYELGFADGLGKRIIVTAKAGTQLPFDLADMPTIFWEGQEHLSGALEERIRTVVKSAVPAAGPPIGPS